MLHIATQTVQWGRHARPLESESAGSRGGLNRQPRTDRPTPRRMSAAVLGVACHGWVQNPFESVNKCDSTSFQWRGFPPGKRGDCALVNLNVCPDPAVAGPSAASAAISGLEQSPLGSIRVDLDVSAAAEVSQNKTTGFISLSDHNGRKKARFRAWGMAGIEPMPSGPIWIGHRFCL